MFVTIKDLQKSEEKAEITVAGMVHDFKDMGKFAFVSLRVADGVVQCVYNYGADVKKLKLESAVTASGEKIDDRRAPNGFEIHIKNVNVLSVPHEDAPDLIKNKSKTSMDADLKYRVVSLRNNRRRAVFALQSALVAGFRAFLSQNAFTEIFSPKIGAGSAEGGANMFKLEYFGQKAFLAQSPQFYKQMLIPVYMRVFEIAPVFRAEKHDTPRHLNEYISVDFEMGFIDSFKDICETERNMLKFTFDYIRENYPNLLSTLKIELPDIKEIPYVTFREAKEAVAAKYNRKIKDPYDLEPEEERLISQMYKEEFDTDFVFVTHYPDKKRPFYAKNDPNDEKYTLSFDLLYKGMEITTGGQRVHNYEEQYAKMERKGLAPADFESYLMLHKYGCPPHGGLGLGLERFCMKILDEANIRTTSLFPRDTARLTP
ncbi:aspartate--tRNA(Asn) ligase [Clostridia bacterium]|nr:aspartate--tRNA(Asn) ligase [Clostridia bacterium]